MRSDSTIAELHEILQIAFGWADDHLHQFLIRGKPYGIGRVGGITFDDNPRQVQLRDFHFRWKETFVMELQDKYPQWEVLPQFAQLLLDHRDNLDDYQDELRRLTYWVVREDFDRQTVNRRLAEYGSGHAGEKGSSGAYSGTVSH